MTPPTQGREAVERAARAMYDILGATLDDSGRVPWWGLTNGERDVQIKAAQAILAAAYPPQGEAIKRLETWHRILCQQVDFEHLDNDEPREVDGRTLHNLEQAIRAVLGRPVGPIWSPPYPQQTRPVHDYRGFSAPEFAGMCSVCREPRDHPNHPPVDPPSQQTEGETQITRKPSEQGEWAAQMRADVEHFRYELRACEADKDRLQRENERLREALEELVNLHDAGYMFPPPYTIGCGDIRSEAWEAARQALESKPSPDDSETQQ